MVCNLCPRNCSVDRCKSLGFCGATNEVVVSKYMVHNWEEPCLVGDFTTTRRGSGAIFFSGCNLRCVYCQNKEISGRVKGTVYSVEGLADLMLDLQNMGVCNINLVTPTHYSHQIRKALDLIKGKLAIPVVYNTSGYEKPEEIEKMRGYVSVFLTDLKYFSSELSQKYSRASDYFEYAIESLRVMLDISPKMVFDKEGILQSGVIVRHLCLPTHRQDSIRILEELGSRFDKDSFKLSLMSQYTPEFCPEEFSQLRRRITTFEYESVVKVALRIGFDGYIQDKSSASAKFTPRF